MVVTGCCAQSPMASGIVISGPKVMVVPEVKSKYGPQSMTAEVVIKLSVGQLTASPISL